MLISVVIPTCNRNDLLIKCLDLLAPKNQDIDEAYEVIVTDDNKDLLAKKLIEENYTWAKWVEGPRKGPASNRNNGAKQASGEWIVFIDDDCLPDQEILKGYKNAIIANPDTKAFEGAILPDDWDKLKMDMSECPVNTDGGCFWSANICINAILFNQIGGFNESYLIAAQEDQQIKIDIEAETNKKIIFLRSCFVIHPVRFTSVARQLKRIPISSKNYVLYAYRNKQVLKIGSIFEFAVSQFRFHLKNTFNLIKAGKLKSIIISFAWLIYGVPLNVINILKLHLKKSK